MESEATKLVEKTLENIDASAILGEDVKTEDEYIKDQQMRLMISPKPSCKHCYGRGYDGWESPVIDKKRLPVNLRNKREHHLVGDKQTCRCIHNQLRWLKKESK